MEQQQMIQMQMLQQEAEDLNQQLQLIEQNLSEIESLKLSLEEIDKNENKEILANIGKKIFLPVEIKDKNLFVEIGKSNFVKKTIPETIQVTEEQTKKLVAGKQDVVKRIEQLQKEVEGLMQTFIKEQGGKAK